MNLRPQFPSPPQKKVLCDVDVELALPAELAVVLRHAGATVLEKKPAASVSSGSARNPQPSSAALRAAWPVSLT